MANQLNAFCERGFVETVPSDPRRPASMLCEGCVNGVLAVLGIAAAVIVGSAHSQEAVRLAALFPPVNQAYASSDGLRVVELGSGVQLSYSGSVEIRSGQSGAQENAFLVTAEGNDPRVSPFRKLDVSSFANQWMEFRIVGRVQSGEIKGNFTVLASGPAGRKGPIPERIARGRNFLCDGKEPCDRRVIVQIPPDVHTLELGFYLYGAGVADVKCLSMKTIPEPEVPPRSQASDLVNRAVDLMAEYSMRASGRDWTTIRNQALRRLPQPATVLDAYDVIYRLVLGLEDNHSKLLVDDEEDSFSPSTSAPGSVVPHQVSVTEGIGVISLKTFGSPDQAVVDQEASALRRELLIAAPLVRIGWIVDLREFRGGGNWAYTAALCPLLRGPVIGAFKNSRGELAKMWCVGESAGIQLDGERSLLATAVGVTDTPESIRTFELPVAVILAESTASAGEALAVQFFGAPGVRLFGQPTAGLASGVEPFKLDENATLALAEGYAVSRTGVEFASAVNPDELTTDLESIANAMRWLNHTEQLGR